MTWKPGQSGNPGGKWRPGQSGNPNGRPKTRDYKEALAEVLDAIGEGDRKAALRKVAAAHIAKCMTGDIAAIKEFGDRYEGKVPTPIGGTDELPGIKGIAWLEPELDAPTSDNAEPEGNESKEIH
ncbi:MAG TPA: DUF5681 domain-containing protein [Candidatus Paceibacterota bacterium]